MRRFIFNDGGPISPPPITYSVGDIAQGGIVCLVWSGGTHGLVASYDLISTGATWGCEGTSITTSDAVGTGQANTNAILAGCATSDIAARLCDNLSLSGYTDWFLPSYRDILGTDGKGIGKAVYNKTGTNISIWSSSQFSSTRAIRADAGGSSSADKSSLRPVRAVRIF